MIDWLKVEQAMRESITGRGTEQGHQLCRDAFRADKERYSELHSRVRDEEFEAERSKWRGNR